MTSETLFASALNLLDELDRSLPHEESDVWPEDVSLRRNIMVWQVAQDAIDNGMPAWINGDTYWPVIYIKLPTGQVSWHVPTNEPPPGISIPVQGFDAWDGHTREMKSERIRQYLEGVHFPKPEQ